VFADSLEPGLIKSKIIGIKIDRSKHIFCAVFAGQRRPEKNERVALWLIFLKATVLPEQ